MSNHCPQKAFIRQVQGKLFVSNEDGEGANYIMLGYSFLFSSQSDPIDENVEIMSTKTMHQAVTLLDKSDEINDKLRIGKKLVY